MATEEKKETELQKTRIQKRVSFAADVKGFTFKTPKAKKKSSSSKHTNSSKHGIDNHWRNFGSLSKSEFSFVSDRTSFVDSLNTITNSNLWIVDPEQDDEEKIDFTKEENQNLKAFTFSSNDENSAYSVGSPSMSEKHHKSASSITFSATVSLFGDTEKRENSLLFYDLWGVPGNTRARSAPDNDHGGSFSIVSMSGSENDKGVHRTASCFVIGAIDEEEEPEESKSEANKPLEVSVKEELPKHRQRKNTITAEFVFGNKEKTEK